MLQQREVQILPRNVCPRTCISGKIWSSVISCCKTLCPALRSCECSSRQFKLTLTLFKILPWGGLLPISPRVRRRQKCLKNSGFASGSAAAARSRALALLKTMDPFLSRERPTSLEHVGRKQLLAVGTHEWIWIIWLRLSAEDWTHALSGLKTLETAIMLLF